jgi:hypothetical protein
MGVPTATRIAKNATEVRWMNGCRRSWKKGSRAIVMKKFQ